jgi:serralysin
MAKVHGSDGKDWLWGAGGDDWLYGHGGDDTLQGRAGADHLYGGDGTDTASYSYSPAGVAVVLFSGLTNSGHAEGDVLLSIENLTGSDHADALLGDGGVNFLAGLNGNDALKGFGGADTLDGGPGADTMTGGLDSDTYVVDNANDVVAEAGGQGVDVVRSSTSWTLTPGADVETLQTTNDNGASSLSLTGNSSGNTVRGNAGNNMLNGGDGDDFLTGLGGYDSFVFNTTLNAATNVDVITDFNVADDRIMLSDSVFSSIYFTPFDNPSLGEFVVGTGALDADDHIIYDSNTGALFYDGDGVGGTVQIQFAQLPPGLDLTRDDFYVW